VSPVTPKSHIISKPAMGAPLIIRMGNPKIRSYMMTSASQ
jgi:hypothetical protein